MPVIYKDKKYKELFCKNDNCRKLVAYSRGTHEEVLFKCPRCGFISLYEINKGQGQTMVEDIENSDVSIQHEIIEDSNNLKNLKGGE
jgi:RNase P subunit RPR2